MMLTKARKDTFPTAYVWLSLQDLANVAEVEMGIQRLGIWDGHVEGAVDAL